jgi:hypothetical protein
MLWFMRTLMGRLYNFSCEYDTLANVGRLVQLSTVSSFLILPFSINSLAISMILTWPSSSFNDEIVSPDVDAE